MNFIKGVYVQGGGREVYSESAGWMTQPFTRMPVSMELSYRFVLSRNAQPSTYRNNTRPFSNRRCNIRNICVI